MTKATEILVLETLLAIAGRLEGEIRISTYQGMPGSVEALHNNLEDQAKLGAALAETLATNNPTVPEATASFGEG